MREVYEVLVNPELNPLRGLPKNVRFQLTLALTLIWSIIFSVCSGMVALVGPSMAVHVLLLLGVFFTAVMFRRATCKNSVYHRAKYRDPSNGCARYDNLWGA
tara:strand:- start:755 stop:1060 length:306 start_codon:yes stop_codon:yes gene_type:complete